MAKKNMILIYDRDRKRYFIGWSGERPMWSDEISQQNIYSSQKQADDDYELLKQLGFNVEVQ